MAFDSTAGGANSNSYPSVAEADAYWESRLLSTWDDAESKEAALMWATRLMDAVFPWTGAASTSTQALGWPRSGMFTRNGFDIAIDAIPNDLKNATSEWAGILAASEEDLTADDDIAKKGITKIKVGSIELGFKTASSQTIEMRNADIMAKWPELAYVSGMVPDSVRVLIPPSWYVRELLLTPGFFFEADR